MSFQGGFPRTFSNASIRAHAPALPGVYGISNGREWILIESADDIQADLLQHANHAQSTRLSELQPTGFAYEVCDPSTRNHRRETLVKQYVPLYASGGSLRTGLG
jgi:hypothetical protein